MSNPTQKILCPGDRAPDFSAEAIGGEYGVEGTTVSLASLAGRQVVLYFYPKDDTPGCTIQACAIRNQWSEVEKQGVALFGVSIDSAESHRKFISKHELPFPLLADTQKEIVTAYGVWTEKSMYGKKYMGTERTTFVISGEGNIQFVFRKVKPVEHLTALLEVLNSPQTKMD